MSSSNLDLVRSIYAMWERGDYNSTEWAHPEIEWIFPDGPDPESWRLAGIAEGWRKFLSAWDEFRITVEEYRALDDERILVFTRYIGRGKSSGVDLGRLGAKGASVFHIRDGKVTRQAFYFDRERALADLGLAAENG
jgi:ketosteroid isomerase-like protein